MLYGYKISAVYIFRVVLSFRYERSFVMVWTYISVVMYPFILVEVVLLVYLISNPSYALVLYISIHIDARTSLVL
jgi:hypothetical protein